MVPKILGSNNLGIKTILSAHIQTSILISPEGKPFHKLSYN